VSITPVLEFVNRILGRSLALAALAALALSVGACDLGGRDRAPLLDSGLDAGPDAGEDAGPVDAGPDASFRDGDAGAWIDDPVVVTGPCDNDCAYTYNVTPQEDGDPYSANQYGRASFDIGPGTSEDVVVARETERFLIFLINGESPGYRQRAIQSFVLDADTHALVSGEALVYNAYCKSLYSGSRGVEMTKHYVFSYDAVAQELTYAVELNDRRWERVLDAPDPPVVMLNHREYPIDTFGFHSPLTALLLAERYDWSEGGVQRVPIFSPELERMDAVELEADGPDTLVVRFPIDTAKPPWHSWTTDAVYDTNNVSISFEYGIPVLVGSRNNLAWAPVYASPAELNLYSPMPTQTIEFPTVPTGGTPITATSGDVTLHGVVDTPSGTAPHAAVVMVPGWDYMTARGEVGAVDLYAQLGQAVVESGAIAARFDARGAGDISAAFSEATVDELVADAEAAVAAVQARGDVDPTRVFLLTTGAGAHVAAGVATGGDVSLAGIILVAPIGGAYLDEESLMSARYFDSADLRESYVGEAQAIITAIFTSLADGTYEGDAYLGHTVAAWQSLFAEDLVSNPIALPPTLILYGVEDHLVPQVLIDDLAAALSGAEPSDGGAELTDVTTAILPGLTHALTSGTAAGLWPEHGGAETVDDSAVTAMTDWLAAIAGGL
jgi:dienelactone hydrolase